ncbi:MAG: inorganic phosphate transporter, partial [Desulfovibrionaceae bacterium]|nr:inorganic phosphate transporter [Desulfovibrionaceae bacterium]
MFEIPLLLILIVVVALIFDFTNGAHDCANAIATVVSTKALSPRTAVLMAAALNFIGALLGEEVAHTLGAGIVNPAVVAGSHILVLAALVGAIAWNLITWYYGIPSSSSHALIGGLVGAAVAHAGVNTLNGMSIIKKVLVPLVFSPLSGFAMGFLIMGLITLLFRNFNRTKV